MQAYLKIFKGINNAHNQKIVHDDEMAKRF